MDEIPTDDPFLWLEEIEGERALAWVQAQNQQTIAALEDPAFAPQRALLREILDNPQRIPPILQRGDFVYNFWTDAAHPRGLWRRTSLADYRNAAPSWDVLLDIDALGAAEGQSWVWHGAQTLPPAHDRALISLSPGGSDAAAIREFDLTTRRFVADGFSLPVSKSRAAWLDADTLLVAAAYDAQVTGAGYPRSVRRLTRGMALAAAPVVFAVEPEDMAAGVSVDHDPAHGYVLFSRRISFWRSICHVELGDGQRHRLEIPEDAECEIDHGRLLLRLRSDWRAAGRQYREGSLLVIGLRAFLAGGRGFTVLFIPAPRCALQSWVSLASGVVLTLLDNVVSRLVFLDEAAGWAETRLGGFPPAATLTVRRLAPYDPQSDSLLFHVEGFLTPTRLMLGTPHAPPATLKQLPAQFDASGLVVEQLEATAEDGTAIPYFLVGPDDAAARQDRPVYLYGYGGFEVSLPPHYIPAMGALWCAQGGRYAVANIRGGGEFGPAWHRAGIREKKRLAQDDFAAVAADLARRGIAPAARIVGAGGSNGGLLIGNMLTRHPRQFGALICTVPLLDMRRYTRLLAGASWIGEYGDPDKPEDWRFLREISAYQLVRPDQPYPPILIATTRRDDRVHPGHARKMAARLQALGYAAWYFEQAEGGHGAGADAAQRALFQALLFAFARQQVARPAG